MKITSKIVHKKFTQFKNTARPKKWSKKDIIKKSKGARCGKVGHWATDCKNEPDDFAKAKMKKRNQKKGSSKGKRGKRARGPSSAKDCRSETHWSHEHYVETYYQAGQCECLDTNCVPGGFTVVPGSNGASNTFVVFRT